MPLEMPPPPFNFWPKDGFDDPEIEKSDRSRDYDDQ